MVYAWALSLQTDLRASQRVVQMCCQRGSGNEAADAHKRRREGEGWGVQATPRPPHQHPDPSDWERRLAEKGALPAQGDGGAVPCLTPPIPGRLQDRVGLRETGPLSKTSAQKKLVCHSFSLAPWDMGHRDRPKWWNQRLITSGKAAEAPAPPPAPSEEPAKQLLWPMGARPARTRQASACPLSPL